MSLFFLLALRHSPIDDQGTTLRPPLGCLYNTQAEIPAIHSRKQRLQKDLRWSTTTVLGILIHVVLLAATAACVLWTLCGALLVVVGHAVLHLCPSPKSCLSLAHAARAGALGGIVISIPVVAIAFVLQHWADTKNRIYHAILHYVLLVAAGAADGVVGAAILKFSVVKGPTLDLPHATAARAVGGTILGAPLTAWKILYPRKSS